ncbi:MAG: hypothetical protein LUF92_16425, partial [Clostridiales bacterium]|nr:hypothetical protein [Clostridiales bacterium]
TGDEIAEGTSILLTISKGPKTVTLSESDYQGKDLSTVEKMLDELYLTYDEDSFDYAYSNSYAQGTVISMTTDCHHDDSISGSLHWDDTVNITVSKGPQPTTASKPTTGSSSSGSSSGGSSSSGSSSNGTSTTQKKKSTSDAFDENAARGN